jgi:hypothetical protein
LVPLLAPAMKANPGVDSGVWDNVKHEVAQGLTKLATQKGGVLDGPFREAVSSLSDAELQRLGAIFDDPAYRKFHAAMANPIARQQFLTATAALAQQIGPMINMVLQTHHLQEVQ